MANKRNIARLIERLERVQKEEPENYHQGSWFCGMAAYACLMDGWKQASRGYVEKDGRERETTFVAQEILGLSDNEAVSLFDELGCWWLNENAPLLRSADDRERVQGAIQELRRYL